MLSSLFSADPLQHFGDLSLIQTSVAETEFLCDSSLRQLLLTDTVDDRRDLSADITNRDLLLTEL